MPPFCEVKSGVIKKQLPPKFSASPIIVSFNCADICKLHIQSNKLKIRILVFIGASFGHELTIQYLAKVLIKCFFHRNNFKKTNYLKQRKKNIVRNSSKVIFVPTKS